MGILSQAKSVSIPLPDGREIILESGRMAKQAGGAVVARLGDTMVLCTVCAGEDKPADFFPLTVEYREKYYSAGKIPGGYFKREAKLSDREVLVCRMIDRPLRPMFPEGYRREASVVADGVIAQAENRVGKGRAHFGQGAEPHFLIGGRIHRRAVHERVSNAGTLENGDARPHALDIVHAGAQDHRFAIRCDVLDERVVVALARADFIGQNTDTKLVGKQFASLVGSAKVLFPIAKESMQSIQQQFTKNTINLPVYETLKKPIEVDSSTNILVFTSPSNVEAFFEKNKWQEHYKAVAMGEATEHALYRKGVKKPAKPISFDDLGLMHCILALS